MIVEFLPEARSELFHAVEYYDGQLNGLGQRFWNEVDQRITWIAENPEVPQLRPQHAILWPGFRHPATAATNALDHDADIAKVQEWLGHANIATTRIYDRRKMTPEDSPTFKVCY